MAMISERDKTSPRDPDLLDAFTTSIQEAGDSKNHREVYDVESAKSAERSALPYRPPLINGSNERGSKEVFPQGDSKFGPGSTTDGRSADHIKKESFEAAKEVMYNKENVKEAREASLNNDGFWNDGFDQFLRKCFGGSRQPPPETSLDRSIRTFVGAFITLLLLSALYFWLAMATKRDVAGGTGEGKNPNLLESIVLGGVACVFTVNFTHPIELVKTRMQVTGNGLVTTVSSLLKNEGVFALWKGIQAAWGREAIYASIKLGGYAPIRDALSTSGKDAPFYLKVVAGAITGGFGSFVGNPFDVMKTMMQANEGEHISMLTLAKQMYHDQGIAGFYRGVQCNVMRACVLNASKMGTYDNAKTHVVAVTAWDRNDPRTVFVSSVFAGFVMTVCVAPFDMIRTKLMNQPTDVKLYSGFIDCTVKTIKNEGVMSLYRGFIPIWGRFAPTATIQLLTFETLYGMFGFASI